MTLPDTIRAFFPAVWNSFSASCNAPFPVMTFPWHYKLMTHIIRLLVGRFVISFNNLDDNIFIFSYQYPYILKIFISLCPQ